MAIKIKNENEKIKFCNEVKMFKRHKVLKDVLFVLIDLLVADVLALEVATDDLKSRRLELEFPPFRSFRAPPSEFHQVDGYLPALREGEPQKEEHDSEEDIKQLLEEKYKFRNDETSTRYKISKQEENNYPGDTYNKLFISNLQLKKI